MEILMYLSGIHPSVCHLSVTHHDSWGSMQRDQHNLVSQLLYASPAWWGYLKVDEKNRLQSVIKKAIWYGYLPRSFCSLGELSEDSDDKLFFSTRYNPNHVLHRLLPQPKNTQYHLRQRTHGLILPTDVNAASKKNFLYRMLFSDIY